MGTRGSNVTGTQKQRYQGWEHTQEREDRPGAKQYGAGKVGNGQTPVRLGQTFGKE